MKQDIDIIFDLEDDLTNCWHIIKDIKLLNESIQNKDIEDHTIDDIANNLLGLETILNLRFEKAWEIFEKVCEEYHRLKEENGEEVKGDYDKEDEDWHNHEEDEWNEDDDPSGKAHRRRPPPATSLERFPPDKSGSISQLLNQDDVKSKRKKIKSFK